MQKFSLSVNIEDGAGQGLKYLATPNARKAAQSLVNGFNTGIHSYTIIGSYGTGKSSFIVALESDLRGRTKYLIRSTDVLAEGIKGFEIINITCDYEDLSTTMARKFGVEGTQANVIDILREKHAFCKSHGKFMVIVLDEFGKALEHAAEKNPGRELYFLQKLAEFVNVPTRNILLITTLHQNFSTYGKKLTEVQRNEWTKVKGRFQEIVFVEPVEQIMFLAANEREKPILTEEQRENIEALQKLSSSTAFTSASYTLDAAERLYPLDPFSAYVITQAIQRYGQNERSLFSFLSAKGKKSFSEFEATDNGTYNLSDAFDYIVDNFYTYLQEANADSMSWSGIRTAVERVEGREWRDEQTFLDAAKIVKALGLLNLFGTASFTLSIEDMAEYASRAMGVKDAKTIVETLISYKIVRYATYKGRLMLYEGTDVNIEDELAKASLVVPKNGNFIDDLNNFFAKRVSLVKACYYHRGTPRYFDYKILSSPEEIIPTKDIDGYVELLFLKKGDTVDEVLEFSSHCENAIIFVIYNNVSSIVTHLYNINRYDYLLQKVLIDKMDYVAINEVNNLKEYETELLNKAIQDGLYSYNNSSTWIYKGKKQDIHSQRGFNELLSDVCDDIYSKTPIINNELINRENLSSNIAGVRARYVEALIEHGDEPDLGFDADKFPPEKTIYYSLLKNTGLHVNGVFNEAPTNKDIEPLWTACEDFLAGSMAKARKISELQQILLNKPYKLKKGLLDYWIPTYLYVKRQDYSLHQVSTGKYIPNVNREFFDLLQKYPGDYSVKAFSVSGVQMAFYNQYRRFINLDDDIFIKRDRFIETIKPFLFFYRRLNDYAKNTKKFDHRSTLRFRDVLAKAKNPEQTFFVDLPEALGYNSDNLKTDEFVQQYCVLIQRTIRELRMCYDRLLDRIEERLVDSLSLNSYEYKEYVEEIRLRLKDVKTYLLTDEQREFHNHVMTVFDNRTEWYQSICYVVLGHNLDQLKDEEEEKLVDDLIYLFTTCERYAKISEITTSDNKYADVFSFDLTTGNGDSVRNQTFVLQQRDEKKVETLEEKISALLSGNNTIDVCTLLRIIRKRMNK